MRRLIFLIFATLNLYGCDATQMWLWEAEKISALPYSTIQLRNKEGEIATTVSRSQISTLLDIKARLERAASISGVRLVIADSKEPNAFAGRAGYPQIGITIGMLNLIGHDNDAYAALIGHELAHLTLGHGAIRQEREDIAKGAGAVLGFILGAAGVPMGGTISDVAVTTLTTVYSRDEERDADKKGFEYMVAAGFDSQGAIRLWQKMSNAGAGFSIPFLSTHPMSSERIDNMRALVVARQSTYASNRAPEIRPSNVENTITRENPTLQVEAPRTAIRESGSNGELSSAKQADKSQATVANASNEPEILRIPALPQQPFNNATRQQKIGCANQAEVINQIVFPKDAIAAGVHQGSVVVQIMIGPTGDVDETKILRSTNSLLEQSALTAAKNLKCTGIGQSYRLEWPIAFNAEQ